MSQLSEGALFRHILGGVLFLLGASKNYQTFLGDYYGGRSMRKIQILDITGTPLNPSPQGKKCPGNGEHSEYECCCDECDYYLECFPQYNLLSGEKQ